MTNDIRLFLFVLTYNLANIALYIESPAEFGKHYGIIDHSLTSFSENTPLENGLLFGILFFSMIFLGFSNQKSYHQYLKRLPPEETPIFMKCFSKPRKKKDIDDWYPMLAESSPPPSNKPSLVFSMIFGAGALYKAVVGASSLAALTKPLAPWNIALSVLAGLGNLVTQAAIFSEPFTNIHISNRYYGRQILAHLLTAMYNVPNMALYYNTGYRFLTTQFPLLLDGNALPIFLIVSSFFLLISTQRSYSNKLETVLSDPKEKDTLNWELSSCDITQNKIKKFTNAEALYTACYKTLINYVSLVEVFKLIYPAEWFGFTAAAPFIPGIFLAMYAVLKRAPNNLEKQEERLFPTESKPCCCGFFPNRQRRPSTLNTLRNHLPMLS